MASEEVARYQEAVVDLARPYVGRANAELDDLVQEGMIHVWHRLAEDLPVSAQFIRFRMADWCNFLARLERHDAQAYNIAMCDDWEDWNRQL